MSRYQTEQRNKLLDLFKNNGHQSFSAYDILDLFDNEEISLSAIYRNLKSMEKDGVICKVSDGKTTGTHYHYVNPHSCVGVIHLKCDSCDNTYHLDRNISALIFNYAKDENNFKINNASAFLYGKCEICSQI